MDVKLMQAYFCINFHSLQLSATPEIQISLRTKNLNQSKQKLGINVEFFTSRACLGEKNFKQDPVTNCSNLLKALNKIKLNQKY